MKVNDELEQKLWELEFGLLADEEAMKLRERIAALPDLKNVQDRVRVQAALVAEASLVRAPRIELSKSEPAISELGESGGNDGSGQSAAGIRRRSSATFWAGRSLVNWAIGIAATWLVGLIGYVVVDRSHHPMNAGISLSKQETAEPVRIVVEGPSKILPDVTYRYLVRTSTPRGEPTSANLNVRLENEAGKVTFAETVVTDPSGRGTIELRNGYGVESEILEVAQVGLTDFGIAVPLEKIPDNYFTYVATDRPWYTPGDKVQYRSVTLSRSSWRADRETTVNFAMLDPVGQVVPAPQSVATQHGVAAADFDLAESLPSGKYTLVAQSAEGLFPESRRDFYVRGSGSNRPWNVAVNWSDAEYKAGESVSATLSVRTMEGEPAPNVRLSLDAAVDGEPIPLAAKEVTTNANGQSNVLFSLPTAINFGNGILRATPPNSSDAVVTEPIPIQTGKTWVDFYPEGGELVAGVENRVYFHSHDAWGLPVAIRGEVLDGEGNRVQEFETRHDGRGAFRVVPRIDQTLGMRIAEPAGITTESTLNSPSQGARVSLDCGAGVFGERESVAVRLRSPLPPPSLVVVVNCRGAMVGHRQIVAADFVDGVCDLNLPVDADGVLRITVYSGEEPLAERLVFREPHRRLALQLDGLQDAYALGDRVTMRARAADESGEPQAAVLGIRVTEELAQRVAGPQPPSLATHFWLLGELDSPARIEDANVLLAPDPQSKEALDLLLGTQGWRRFRVAPTSQVEKFAAMTAGFAFDVKEGAVRQDADGLRRAESNALGSLNDSMLAAEYGVVDATTELPQRFDNGVKLNFKNANLARGAITDEGFRPSDMWQHPVLRVLILTTSVLVLLAAVGALLLPLASHRGVAAFGVAVAVCGLCFGLYLQTAPKEFDGTTGLAQATAPIPEARVKSIEDLASLGERDADQPTSSRGAAVLNAEVRPAPVPTATGEVAGSLRGGTPASTESEARTFSFSQPSDARLQDFNDNLEAQKRKAAAESAALGDSPVGRKLDEQTLQAGKPASKTEAGEQTPAPAATASVAAVPANAAPATAGQGIPALAGPAARPAATPLSTLPAGGAGGATSPDISSVVTAPALSASSGPKPEPKPTPTNSPEAVSPTDGFFRQRYFAPAAPVTQKGLPEVKQQLELQKDVTSLHDAIRPNAPPTPEAKIPDQKQTPAEPDAKLLTERLSESAAQPGNAGVARGLGRQEGEQLRAGGQQLMKENVVKESETQAGRRPMQAIQDDKFGAQAAASRFERVYASPSRLSQLARQQRFVNATLYWNPLLVTDTNGRAVVDFSLPDVPATYRLQVDGHQNGRLGSFSREIEVRGQPQK